MVLESRMGGNACFVCVVGPLVALVALFHLYECFVQEMTVVEFEENVPSSITCFNGTPPYVWGYSASLKNKPDSWVEHEGNTQTITIKEDTNGYFRCHDSSTHPVKIFYIVGKKVSPSSNAVSGNGALIGVIVLVVLFGIGFLVMVAFFALKFYKSRASQHNVTVREKLKREDRVVPVRQNSVDDDGYILPLQEDNRDSDYLEVLPPSNRSPRAQPTSNGPLYENVENLRKTRMSTNLH